jgi:hypothetical protein
LLGGLKRLRSSGAAARDAMATTVSTGAADSSRLATTLAFIAGRAPIEAQALSRSAANAKHAVLTMTTPAAFERRYAD